jgi:hypothetical protein
MFVPLLLETPKKALVHCTKPKFSPENALLVHCTKPMNIFSRKQNAFFATRKDVQSYSQMPGKLAFEFSNFSGGGPRPPPGGSAVVYTTIIA